MGQPIHRLGAFLLELGKGFCFIGRQKRITLDGDHFYIDLVLYNRLLRSFVLEEAARRARTLTPSGSGVRPEWP